MLIELVTAALDKGDLDFAYKVCTREQLTVTHIERSTVRWIVPEDSIHLEVQTDSISLNLYMEDSMVPGAMNALQGEIKVLSYKAAKSMLVAILTKEHLIYGFHTGVSYWLYRKCQTKNFKNIVICKILDHEDTIRTPL